MWVSELPAHPPHCKSTAQSRRIISQRHRSSRQQFRNSRRARALTPPRRVRVRHSIFAFAWSAAGAEARVRRTGRITAAMLVQEVIQHSALPYSSPMAVVVAPIAPISEIRRGVPEAQPHLELLLGFLCKVVPAVLAAFPMRPA